MEAARHMRHASIAKAVVKSSQAKGSLEEKVVNSKMRMRNVKKKQKHHVNIHHAQYGELKYPADATRLKHIQVRMDAIILMMPTGWVSARRFTRTMAAYSSCVRPKKKE